MSKELTPVQVLEEMLALVRAMREVQAPNYSPLRHAFNEAADRLDNLVSTMNDHARFSAPSVPPEDASDGKYRIRTVARHRPEGPT